MRTSSGEANCETDWVKHCLNSRIACCTLRVTDFASGRTETLRTSNRAAFEILTDDPDHGIDIRV